MVDFRACEGLGIPSICLMENAGAGAAGIVLERWGAGGARVACVCGPGKNGGDGLVVARHLAVAGHKVGIVVLAGPESIDATGDAGLNLRVCQALRLPIRFVAPDATPSDCGTWLVGFDVVVDGLFGTGLTRPIAGAAAEAVEAVNASALPVLALDLPSGLDCDTGMSLGPCVRADVTATFAARKVGFANPESRRWTGEVVVVAIGAPVDAVDSQG